MLPWDPTLWTALLVQAFCLCSYGVHIDVISRIASPAPCLLSLCKHGDHDAEVLVEARLRTGLWALYRPSAAVALLGYWAENS